jgi:hypothetical protein
MPAFGIPVAPAGGYLQIPGALAINFWRDLEHLQKQKEELHRNDQERQYNKDL